MRQPTQFIILSIVIASLLSGTYYWFWLKPQLEIPNALIAAETALHGKRHLQAQMRLAIFELARLPSSPNIGQTHNQLIQKLHSLYIQAQNSTETDLPYEPLAGAPTNQIQFINQELPQALSDLEQRHRQLIARQQSVIETLVQSQENLADIYNYNPALDLGSLDASTQNNQISERAATAMQGLQKVIESLPSLNLPNQPKENLEQQLQYSLQLLHELSTATASNHTQEINALRTDFIRQFPQVQRAALHAEHALLTSPESVTMLADTTNLLLAYDFWLDRINQELQNL